MEHLKDKELQIRQLTDGDIPFAMELKNIAGWNQLPVDWKGYLSYEAEGCFIGEIDGDKAGTVTSIDYEKRFGWVGMVLVHPSKRRMGIGNTLLEKSIEYLQNKGVQCIKLDATPMGKQVYTPLGFVDEYDLHRYEGVSKVEKGSFENVEPITDENLKDIVEFDEQYFGANRHDVIQALYNRNKELCFFTADAEGISGYIMVREGYSAYQIGPWISSDEATTEELLTTALGKISGEKVFLDVPCPNEEAITLMEKYSFTVQRPFSRMYLGDNDHPGIVSGVYATSGPELG